MHFKKGIVSTALSLALILPSVTLVNSDSIVKKDAITVNNSIEERIENKRLELTPEAKEKINELKAKLKNGEIDKKEFHKEIKKILPKGYKFKHRGNKHHQKINLTDEEKEQLIELKLKLKNEEISKEQFKEEIKQIVPKLKQR